MKTVKELDEQIEALRSELYALVLTHAGNMQHPDVQELSARLDRLIVVWQKQRQQPDEVVYPKKRKRKKAANN